MTFILGLLATAFAGIRKGWQYVKPHATIRNLLMVVGIVGFLTGVILIYRACNKPAPPLTPKEVIEARTAIATRDDATMRKILVDSDAREAVPDSTIANAKADTVNAQYESKQKWGNASTDEMAAELERRAKQ